MIYTVISFSSEREKEDFSAIKPYICFDEAASFSQSIIHPTEELLSFIESKNAPHKMDRICAYTTLLCSLKLFFGIDDAVIERSIDGKPHLVGYENIHFSISHHDGIIAVCLSDEGEVGVDVQGNIRESVEKRLRERFLSFSLASDCRVNNGDEINYFFCNFNGETALFSPFDPPQADLDNTTSMWVIFESLIKLDGRGFGATSEVENIFSCAEVNVKSLPLKNRQCYFATSVYKKNKKTVLC